jgi:formimidoylglutamate deiminase
MLRLTADWALLDDGFAPDVHITVQDGLITQVSREGEGSQTPAERVGVVLPGMADLHSHAFQRVFAGLTAHQGGGGDFWTWRDAMYRAAARMTPELYAPVAAWLGKELLKGGYTALAEFHYLHRDPAGAVYADPAAMAGAVFAGAATAGISVTVLVGLYETAGFDGAPLSAAQRRFHANAASALSMADALAAAHPGGVGLALHSLRAVPPDTLARAVPAFTAAHPTAPIHIHVAEQRAEVEACNATLGAPPIAWLLDHAPVDARWCLVHATHGTPAELHAAARTGAVAGLCPSTEADLGDGIFDFPAWLEAAGAFGIGSDSNLTLDALAELRLLEWGQRLKLQRRNVAAAAEKPCGRALWQAAAAGGARACGDAAGRIAAGSRADLVVLQATPESAALGPDFVLDAAMFAATSSAVRHVMANGDWVVRDFRHRNEDAIDVAYAAALRKLAA